MKINKETELSDFLATVKLAKGDVYLRSQMGDQYNLKSELSKYIAIGAMIGEGAEHLELFCANSADEALFFKFFEKFPNTL